jgi:DNA modification methylase
MPSEDAQETTEIEAPVILSPGLEYHPFATAFPEMPQTEFESLRDDIEKNGLHDNVILFKGKIADGRHRYKALQELGWDNATEHFEEFTGTEDQLFELVMSANMRRRHLDTSQRAMIAAKFANLEWGQKKADAENSVSLADAKKLFNVSEDSIRFAKIVQASAYEDIKAKVFNGVLAVSKAKLEVMKRDNPVVKPKIPPRMSKEYIKRRGIMLTKLPALSLLNAIENGAIDAVISDPPYNSGISGGWDHNFDPAPYLKEFGRVLKKGGSAILFCNNRLLTDYVSSSPVIGNPPTVKEVDAANAAWKKAESLLKNDKTYKDLIKARDKAEKAYNAILLRRDRDNENSPTDGEVASANEALKKAEKMLKNDKTCNILIKAEEDTLKVYNDIRNRRDKENAKPLVVTQIMHWYKSNNNEWRLSNKNSYTPAIEYIIWLTRPGGKHTWNEVATWGFRDLFNGQKRVTDLITTPMVGGSYAGSEANRNSGKESPKPFRLMELLIKAHSNVGDIVLDPFHGKGITALVSYLTGRNCLTGELDERKVHGVQQWRMTDMFQYTAQDTNLIDPDVPITEAQLMSVSEIKEIMELNEFKAGVNKVKKLNKVDITLSPQEQLEQWREYYIYCKYIWDILAVHPEFTKVKNNELVDSKRQKKFRMNAWGAEDLLDDDYHHLPKNLIRNIYPDFPQFNFPELEEGRLFDPAHPPADDVLRLAYQREFGDDTHPYVFDVLPVGRYSLVRTGVPPHNEDVAAFRRRENGLPPEINEHSKQAQSMIKAHRDKVYQEGWEEDLISEGLMERPIEPATESAE